MELTFDEDFVFFLEPIKPKSGLSSLFKFKRLDRLEAEQDAPCKSQEKFNDRDNMLLQNSIAEDYWRSVIDKIKRQESASTDERNISFVASSPNSHTNYTTHEESVRRSFLA
jgi:hypothetical protein